MNEDELIAQNVAKMRAKGASDDQVRHYLTLEGLTPKTSQPSGAVTGNVDLRTTQEPPRIQSTPPAHSNALTSMAFGGARGGSANFSDELAGVIGALAQGSSYTGDFKKNFQTSRADYQSKEHEAANSHPIAHGVGELLGSLPAAAELGPLGLVKGGAAYGALQGAGNDGDLTTRAKNSVIGGVIGGITSKGAQIAGRGVKHLADRSGATDLIEKGIDKISPALASTMGTRGQVNEALGKRQQILDAIGGSKESGGTQLLERQGTRKATAKTLYDAARADSRALQDPELTTLLNDPQIQKAYQTASAIREAGGNPLQKIASPDQVPLALQKMGVSQERYTQLQGLNQSRRIGISGTEVLPPELLGEQAKGVEAPDPEVLHQVKRYIYSALKGRQDSGSPISQDEAAALAPKYEAIRNKLHELSPAWKDADAYYSQAMGQEDAFIKGYNAFRSGLNPTGGQLAKTSPEKLASEMTQPRYSGESPADLVARRKAFQEGTKAAAVQQIKGKPVERNLQSVLGSKALAPTENAKGVRSLMFETPQGGDQLETTLSRLRGEGMEASGSSKVGEPVGHSGLLRSLLHIVSREPDLVSTPKGQTKLSELINNPGLLGIEQGLYNQGNPLSDYLKKSASIGSGSMLTRAVTP